jgi:5'-methylthioadenosine phosphorylase
MEKVKLGIVGGSGIYEIDGVQEGKWISVDTPFGAPSDEIFTGSLNGIDVAFLPRHGRGHVHTPSNVPYRANICALKSIGVTEIVSLSACGSLRKDMNPGEFVIVDQFIDRTFQRSKTFFDQGCVAHVSVADPVCHRLGDMCRKVMDDLGLTYHDKGTYVTMEGPQFSTRAESILYKDVWNCDVIGMTNMPEAKLAREAEICYASIAMVTDFDCWHEDHDSVEVTDIIKTLTANAASAKSLVKSLCASAEGSKTVCPDGCDRALEYAIITDRTRIADDERERLRHVAGRVL